ncbi:MAG: hypothetical protein QNJ71_08065 [Acidimicrobiia bacterium]|nr:hypothetical protein [Acidimicrobiia bacterium]
MGHFLTREDAARRAHVSEDEVRHRPDLLRVGGRWLDEVYFEFQFDDRGIRRDLSRVVRTLRSDYDDIEIADWMATPNRVLDQLTPIRWCASGRDGGRLGTAARTCGPEHDCDGGPAG